jgi:hypothetical protein
MAGLGSKSGEHTMLRRAQPTAASRLWPSLALAARLRNFPQLAVAQGPAREGMLLAPAPERTYSTRMPNRPRGCCG